MAQSAFHIASFTGFICGLDEVIYWMVKYQYPSHELIATFCNVPKPGLCNSLSQSDLFHNISARPILIVLQALPKLLFSRYLKYLIKVSSIGSLLVTHLTITWLLFYHVLVVFDFDWKASNPRFSSFLWCSRCFFFRRFSLLTLPDLDTKLI